MAQDGNAGRDLIQVGRDYVRHININIASGNWLVVAISLIPPILAFSLLGIGVQWTVNVIQPASVNLSEPADPDKVAQRVQKLLETKKCRKCDLRGADLSDRDLSGADLRNTDLSRASLRKTSLKDAKLSGANLEKANFSDAELFNADLSDANLYEASFYKVEMSYSNLSGANLRQSRFIAANLSHANLAKVDLRSAKLQYTSLKNVDLSNSDLSNIYLNMSLGATLDGANLSNVDLRGLSGITTEELRKVEGINLCNTILPDNTTSKQGC
ncbi:pentapeptide repeat-containing protein [Lusitaniella coriacea]|uniref:pentapeptide repeat-containing protein n=1 Tax=Lusitaniella coriacea TaxID=1983105 RepID=UPI003CF536E5